LRITHKAGVHLLIYASHLILASKSYFTTRDGCWHAS